MLPANRVYFSGSSSRVEQPPPPPREMKFSGFDASAYERAAKAIKEIDRSSMIK